MTTHTFSMLDPAKWPHPFIYQTWRKVHQFAQKTFNSTFGQDTSWKDQDKERHDGPTIDL